MFPSQPLSEHKSSPRKYFKVDKFLSSAAAFFAVFLTLGTILWAVSSAVFLTREEYQAAEIERAKVSTGVEFQLKNVDKSLKNLTDTIKLIRVNIEGITGDVNYLRRKKRR